MDKRIFLRTHLEDEYRQLFRNLSTPERIRQFDPEAFARKAKEDGFTVVHVDAKNQGYALHDTDVYVKHPVLGDRDLFQETTDACRKHGLKLVAYIAPNNYDAWLHQKKEQWQQRRSDGTLISQNSGQACFDTGYGELFCNHMAEITRKYRPQGFFIDGLILFKECCYCEACRSRFKAEQGYEMLAQPDWNDPRWYEVVKFRYRQIEDWARRVHEAIHGIDPRVEIILNVPHGWCGWYSGQSHLLTQYIDRLDTEPDPPYQLQASLLTLATWSHFRIMAVRMLASGRRSHTYTYLTPNIPEAECNLTIDSFLAAGSIPCIQGSSPFLGSLAKRTGQVEPYLVKSEEARQVGVVWSDLTRDAFYQQDDAAFFSQMQGVSRTLMESQVPMSFVGDHQLDANDLAGYKLLILPNVTTLSDDSWANVQRYVQKGGRVLAIGKAGVLDAVGRTKTDELLWTGSGLRMLREIKTEGGDWVGPDGLCQDHIPARPNQYMHLSDQQKARYGVDLSATLDGGGWCVHEISGYVDGTLHAPMPALAVEGDAAWATLIPLVHRVRPLDEPITTPGLCCRKLGKGAIYYLAADFGAMAGLTEITNWHNLFVGIVKEASQPLDIDVQAPPSVFASIFKQAKAKRYLVQLVNDLGVEGRPCSRASMRTQMVPVDATMLVRLPGAKSVKKVAGSAGVRTRKTKDGLVVSVKGMADRVALVVE